MVNTNRKEKMRANDMSAEDHAELVKKRDKMKMPKYYFSYNDGTPSEELADCIMDECESAGLIIEADEEMAEKRGYDNYFEVSNPAADKLAKIKKILKINIKQWDETQHDPVEEFKLLVEIINEKN